jgi:hypothetical protein
MISQDEERQGALYVRQKEDDNDAKKMEGRLLDLRGIKVGHGAGEEMEDKYVKEGKRG